MKKLILVAFAVFALTFTNAQELRAAISGGIPVGDASDFTSFAIAVELGYLFDLSETFSLGPAAGYNSSFLKSEFEGDNVSFLPLSAAGRFNASDKFTVGGDIGYGVGLNDGNDGGFYYAPRAQFGVSETIDIVLAYRAFSNDGESFNQITLGIDIGL